jgi:hypothetical protein
MAASRATLPVPVLEAIEECIKQAERYGFLASREQASSDEPKLSFQRLQQKRRALVEAIERHAASMYEGGIEMGQAQAGEHDDRAAIE